jgi:SAM-dependent methyltransferase
MTLSRREKLLGGLDLPNMVGVEIGALANPFVRREDGEIMYVDYTDRDTLVAKYKSDPHVNVDNIVHVDAIWGDNTLDDAVKGRKVDYVVASHVIEHVPDMITWLNEIRSILKESGSVRLIVPDRRFTFDFLREETRVSDLLASYAVRARIPQPYSVIDHAMNVTTVDCQAAWEGKIDADKLVRLHAFDGVLKLAHDVVNNKAYHDVHCWVFTPKSFARLMGRLGELGLLDFACEGFHDTEAGFFDFFITLRPESSKEKIIESWKQVELEAQDHTFSAKQHEGQESQTDLQEQVRRLQSENERLKHLEQEIAIATAEKYQLCEEIKKSSQNIQRMGRDIVDIRNSTSWQITAPLRAASTAFRQMFSRK